jgi:hypothetical protein
MGLGYMWIRFGAPYNGVTATPTGMKRPVYVQSTWCVLIDMNDLTHSQIQILNFKFKFNFFK